MVIHSLVTRVLLQLQHILHTVYKVKKYKFINDMKIENNI
jgi:hypothetical protein